MIEVKVVQIGNSLGIVLPKDVVNYLDIEKGSKLTIVREKGGVYVTGFDQDFDEAMAIAKRGMKRYKSALAELAK